MRLLPLLPALALIVPAPAAAEDGASPLDILHALYATEAAIFRCGIPVERSVRDAISTDIVVVERELGWPRNDLDEERLAVEQVVELEDPDCSIGSSDLRDVHRFIAGYRDRP